MSNRDNVYITLFSNASQSLYPQNSHAAFWCDLATPIDLGTTHTWEVGLCEYLHPNAKEDAKNYRPSHAFIYCDTISLQCVGTSLVRCLSTSLSFYFWTLHIWSRFLFTCWETVLSVDFIWGADSFRNASSITFHQNTFNYYLIYQTRTSLVSI